MAKNNRVPERIQADILSAKYLFVPSKHTDWKEIRYKCNLYIPFHDDNGTLHLMFDELISDWLRLFP